MKNTSLVLVIAACVVLASCTTPSSVRRSGTAADYTAYVSVVNGRPVVYPEAILVRTKDAHVYWYLDEHAGYHFADDGIVIAYNDGEFEKCKANDRGDKLDGGLTFHCKDKNHKHDTHSHPRGYKYTIKLQPIKGGAPIDLDPMFMND